MVTTLKVGDKVRILDGSNLVNYCCGWAANMSKYVGDTYIVKGFDGPRGVLLEGNIYNWDVRGLELVEEAKMENKIILNGVEYTLSTELAEKLMAEVTEQKAQKDLKSPFEREDFDTFFFITTFGTVNYDTDDKLQSDDDKYNVANYCRDKGMMEQRALHETLNRLLWRYSETHGGDGSWERLSIHYHIRRWRDCGFKVSYCEDGKTNGVVYFNSRDVAEAAIDEVVKPFMEAHPEFVW